MALFGADSPHALAWVEARKDQLYTQGAAPILAALAALCPSTPEAQEALHAAVSYFTTHAARMDYPRFVARQLPIGSGAVESSCKCLVEARAKQAGMRWSTPGLQHLTSLRVVHRSGRWGTFWQTQPHRLRRRERTPAPAPPPHRLVGAVPAVPPRPLPSTQTRATEEAAQVAAVPRPRPRPTARQRPLLLPRSA